jgi:ferredoxin
MPKLSRGKISARWRLGKYVTLAAVLIAAAAGNLGLMILDPVTIVMRPLQELAKPFVGSDAVGQSIGTGLGRQLVPSVAFLSLLPLAIVLALSLIDRRFWCRNLCPLGGLLALVSKVPGLRRGVMRDTCTSCARCAKACPTNAIGTGGGFASDPSECITCLACIDSCKTGANVFAFQTSSVQLPVFESSRRDALIAAGATGLGLAAILVPIATADAEILRPPSTDENRLAELCVRCGACYGACPTGNLRPSVSFASGAGPWTPMLDERPAHCTLNCNLCARPCPTDALHTPTPQEAQDLGLGVKADVDQSRCRAWARNHQCMICQSACPIAGALLSQERPAELPGRGPRVQVPVVNPDLCVGCDQCATVCIVGPPAIGTRLPVFYDTAPTTPGMPPGMAPGQPQMPSMPMTPGG